MNAIIFQNHVNNIHGALIDAIDYYLTILEYNKDIKLFIINYTPTFKKILLNLIYNRYNLDGLDFEKNIRALDKNDLIRIKFDRLLLLDYATIKTVKGLVHIRNKDSKIIIISDLHTDNNDYMINKNLYPNDCVLYYGEMPYVYKDIIYTNKMLFDRLKPLKNVESGIFLHSPENTNFDFIPALNLPSNKKIIYKTHEHKQNLFELFDMFIYYHANKWFDPRPRLMHECAYYGKQILYYNNFNIKDGSYYRHKDLVKRGFSHRSLTKDDEIVKQFI